MFEHIVQGVGLLLIFAACRELWNAYSALPPCCPKCEYLRRMAEFHQKVDQYR